MLKKVIAIMISLIVVFGLVGCKPLTPEEEKEDVVQQQPISVESVISGSKLQYPAVNELFYYNVYDTYVKITKFLGEGVFIQNESGLVNPVDIIIPDMIDGLPVYIIGENAFAGSSIETIQISKNVAEIEDGAFSNCKKLKTVTFTDVKDTGDNIVTGNGIIYLDRNTFSGCISLRSITLPDSVKLLEPYVFSECSSLTAINIPKGISEIPEGFCRGCTMLKDIYVADSVNSIADSAFKGVASDAKIHGGIYSASAQYAAANFMLFTIDNESTENNS